MPDFFLFYFIIKVYIPITHNSSFSGPELGHGLSYLGDWIAFTMWAMCYFKTQLLTC